MSSARGPERGDGVQPAVGRPPSESERGWGPASRHQDWLPLPSAGAGKAKGRRAKRVSERGGPASIKKR